MRRYLLLLFLTIVSTPILAQLEVKEGSFKEVPGFININTDKMYDENDKPYAVLKIKTENIGSKERRELSFKGDAQTFIEIEYQDGEVWLYISYYASYIKISHEEYSSTEFYFPYDMKPKCGYELTLVNKSLISGQIRRNDNNVIKSTGNSIIYRAFSVGPDKKVYFSKGNIQYQASTDTWRFAEQQWEFIGNSNNYISPSYNGWIDLFGWGTGNNPTNFSTSDDDYGTYYEWGYNKFINDDSLNTWRTLTRDEWAYLFNERNTSSDTRFVKAIVNGVNGIVILPDDWNIDYFDFKNKNNMLEDYSSNIISQNEWFYIFEPNNAAFLPAAGCRYGNSVCDVGLGGYYMASTYYGANRVWFGLPWHGPAINDNRFNGLSVRLVRDIE